MNVVEIDSSGPRGYEPASPARSRFWALAIAGAVALWLANLVISRTPVAAAYRPALASSVADPVHWLLVATAFTAIRFLALGVAVGLLARAGQARRNPQIQ